MSKSRKTIRLLTSVLALIMIISTFLTVYMSATNGTNYGSSPSIQLHNGSLNTGVEQFYDGRVLYKLPSSVKSEDELSLIIQTKSTSLADAYKKSETKLSFSEYAKTKEADAIRNKIEKENSYLIDKLTKAGIEFECGVSYNTVMSGFEIVAKASEYIEICKTVSSDSLVIIGDEYERADSKLVNNDVDVYDTGIFDSSDFAYNGSGMIVAVLDTGLDYYHTAFSDANFAKHNSGKYSLTFDDVKNGISGTEAQNMRPGLTASDVYISTKVPFSFDYADGDSDVYPINSDHGTHVAGVIAGHDDTITGVAPGAQLAIMKIFSDTMSTSRTAWIIAALEDCVTLGVDVINMSIGTSCGFGTETTEEAVSGVYEEIKKLGIGLIVAASNSYNSTYGSEKNGNLGLTSNPDSATVGSPSTYPGAMSVASIEGAKTPYLLYGDSIIYYIESTDRVSEEKDFIDDLLGKDKDSITIEYVTIPGIGGSADYIGLDVTGKIALVKRGDTTFEEKVSVAMSKNAAGVIIYNNVSGDIKMNVGDATIAVCSISQDDGELLASKERGTISISRSQTSGPFMSDFSSWGPTPSLQIKPEITAHGGSILSAVPGQDYDRISGTSMATPNVSGLTALLRQYVKENFPEAKDNNVELNRIVNRLMMSTADVIINKNGLPYSIRKQGAGLANLNKASTTNAYIITYDEDGNEMEKPKLELGDDPSKTGDYALVFSVKNFGSTTLSYGISTYVLTEGVSETETSHGETTVTETAYSLDGAMMTVLSVKGGKCSGNTIEVAAGETATVTMKITLSDSDKQYLNESFENGMYVEGFVLLDAKNEGSVDLNVPYLAFYGDWTKAPLFDLDYFETNKDELDDSISLLDKTLPDAYATRPIGGTTGDYVSFLGSYYFVQDPASSMISADRKYISLSNQPDAINSLRFVWAGMLRNARRVVTTITDDATGEVVYTTTDFDIRKSYGEGGPIYPANIDIEFSAIERNLKNNTSYTVTLQGYLDYGDGGEETNLKNTFSFPLVTDFEAPAITDCEFYTEYDRSAKKTRLFAKMAVYDNHYSMSLQIGYVSPTGVGGTTEATFYTFDKYLTPVHSQKNSTTYVTYELTDYVDEIAANSYYPNSFTVVAYDYALNTATYDIALPDDYSDFFFEEKKDSDSKISITYVDSKGKTQTEKVDMTLSPNEVYNLAPTVYPATEWSSFVRYDSTNENVARIVGDQIIAISSGFTKIKASFTTEDGKTLSDEFSLYVLSPTDRGYKKYDKPVTDSFVLTGYYTDYAYYRVSTDDRDIGETGNEMKFGSSFLLEMFPSEEVTLRYDINPYFPEDVEITFSSGNEKIAKVDKNGKISAVAEGSTSVMVKVLMDGKSTYYSQSIMITVKDPYITQGPSLSNYYGLGGVVKIPDDLNVTSIGQFAFTNYDYVEKEPYEIYPGDTDTMKMWYLGDSKITEIIIPEGVESIGPYAFASIKSLEKVTLPKTLKMIDYGAFMGCENLKSVKGLENVKFINQSAFQGCALDGNLNLSSVVAIANYAFAGITQLDSLALPSTIQSIGAYAFAGDKSLETVTISAEKVKLGEYAFSECSSLKEISVNASVIPTGAFNECTSLGKATLGVDVAVVGEYAFRNTKIAKFNVASGNATYKNGEHDALISDDGKTILLVAPALTIYENYTATAVAAGAFSGNGNITEVVLPSVTEIGDYAFAECAKLAEVTFADSGLEKIGSFAFETTAITSLPTFSSKLQSIGDYAFYASKLKTVNISDGLKIGAFAFANCESLAEVTIGNNVTIGANAFMRNVNNLETVFDNKEGVYYNDYVSSLIWLTIGDNVNIGDGAFSGASDIITVTLGDGAIIGEYAFFNCAKLKNIDLSKAKSIGYAAFNGYMDYVYKDEACSSIVMKDGEYVYRYFTPVFTSVDLSSLEHLGDLAFAYCKSLTSVTLGDKLTKIGAGSFQACSMLAAINLDNIVEIGEYSFAECALNSLNLAKATTIGKYSFCYNKPLASVSLNATEIGEIGEGAFAYCTSLITLENEGKIRKFGDYSFACTLINEADLASAEYLGAQAFMRNTDSYKIDEIKAGVSKFTILNLNEGLVDIGDNPFALYTIDPLSTVKVTGSFNGKDYTETVYTYSLNDNVEIIDGSIYRVVPNGLELIVWAGGGTAKIADGTVRVGSMACAGMDINRVILPESVASIGHKAFYACTELAYVSFASFEAPILEEEYDQYLVYYFDEENKICTIPATGEYDFYDSDGNTLTYNGLGLIPFFMWNASGSPTSTYYGANFVDYIGIIENKITMVRPTNGVRYDSFIFSQYFDSVIDGGAAMDDTTRAAIELISKLPSSNSIKLSDKATVEAARAAYNLIMSLEQRALVPNLELLTRAEKRIADLEYLANEETDAPTEDENDESENVPDEPVEEPDNKGNSLTIIIVCIASALVIGAGVTVFFIWKKRN